jgi:hypothetical protein
MNDLSEIHITHGARRWMRSLAAGSAELAKRSVALVLVWLMIPLGIADMTAFAQEAPPPPPDQAQPAPDQGAPPPDQDQGQPPQAYNALSPDQLNQLVAPIALYPDSLVAQVLAAATYPTQIVDADRFVQANQGQPPDQIAQMVNGQPWDPSVKALAAFPSVLSNMDKNLDWTTQLGNAYYNQPQDVMSAVQNDRQQAYQSGRLRSTPQLNVEYQPGDVVIEPANPAVVYVPYYNPWTVWGWGRPWFAWYAPPPPPGYFIGAGLAFGFGVGIAIGAWGHWGWGWGHWGMGWGPHPFVAYNHVTYVSRSVTVVNHGYYGHFDRNPGARAWNMHAAAQARAAGYNRGYNAGARAGYNHGAVAGYNRGYNRGAAAGYNRGVEANHGAVNNYNRGAVNRPGQTFNRPAQNYNRPAQNYSRPAQNYSRPSGNYNRPAQGGHAAPQSHQAAPHAESHPSAPHGGGGHPGGGHGHGR